MRKFSLLASFLIFLALIIEFGLAQRVCIYLFYGATCPHCASEKTFLEELKRKYPIEVHEFEVYYSKENFEMWKKICSQYNTQPVGVPMTFIGNKVFVGFSYGNEENFDKRYNAYLGSSGIIERTIEEYLKNGGVVCPEVLENITLVENTSLQGNLSTATSISTNLHLKILLLFALLVLIIFFIGVLKFKAKLKVSK